MNMTQRDNKDFIIKICHNLWTLGWVAGNDGNISVRLEDGTFWTTPTGISKSFLTPEMLVRVDKEGAVLEAAEGYRPSSELKVHLRCYAERPDVNAVIHAHPPTATGFAVANLALDRYLLPEAVANLGAVPVVPYETPGSWELPQGIAPYLQDHDCVLMQNHGALTVGADLTGAYYKMETLELSAKTCLVAMQLGGAVELSREKIDEILALREALHFPGRHPGFRRYRPE